MKRPISIITSKFPTTLNAAFITPTTHAFPVVADGGFMEKAETVFLIEATVFLGIGEGHQRPAAPSLDVRNESVADQPTADSLSLTVGTDSERTEVPDALTALFIDDNARGRD